jgi:hypothetical protein
VSRLSRKFEILNISQHNTWPPPSLSLLCFV